jgi:predicted nucleic acid-binding protein
MDRLIKAGMWISEVFYHRIMILKTGNLKHFQGVPQLTAENWLI